uniref:RCC1-like domain-containing protein n=1 Tax=Branchiostoma floridae TaxID=7739 RepID=C3Y604_BRAFL|eukprot:XP_002608391.1 hypothetical protein BRAFLDRAFT_95399 [Branchiostoma floridae]
MSRNGVQVRNTTLCQAVQYSPTYKQKGANSYGQLGVGHCDDRHSPQQLEGVNFRVKAVTGGGGHTAFISAEGRLFVCGWNQKGQLGLGHREDVSVLTQVTTLTEPVDTVACGWDFTLAVTEDGQLFSWGSNAFGQLGVPEVKGHTSVPTPVQTLQGVRIVGVAAGLRHAVALDDTGSVWTWGAGKRGQLGRLEEGRCPTVSKQTGKVQLDVESSIVAVKAGSYHSLALTEDKRVWTWGRADYGQLGRFGDRTVMPHSCSQPAELSSLYGVKQVGTIPTVLENFKNMEFECEKDSKGSLWGHCAIFGCGNGRGKVEKWQEEECATHPGGQGYAPNISVMESRRSPTHTLPNTLGTMPSHPLHENHQQLESHFSPHLQVNKQQVVKWLVSLKHIYINTLNCLRIQLTWLQCTIQFQLGKYCRKTVNTATVQSHRTLLARTVSNYNKKMKG